MFTIDYILNHSKLPGPRANLELLYQFTTSALKEDINQCLLIDEVALNTPEEFALSCGVSASIWHSAKENQKVTFDFKPYASHESWRVREAVCIGFQKSMPLLSAQQLKSDLSILKSGGPLEKRTYIATLCEPALLSNYIDTKTLLEEMYDITIENFSHSGKLSEDLTVLRKALGYCWSVALCGAFAELETFEKLLEHKDHKHIQWIIQENLKKKRLEKLNSQWLEEFKLRVSKG